jgi:hypothetical protein
VWLPGKFLTIAAWFTISASCLAQAQSAKPSVKAAAVQKRYCQQGGGFCFSYPAKWLMLGQYAGGVIVAPQQTLERALWDEVTVAAIVDPSADAQPPLSIDQVIATAMTNMTAGGHAPTTLQRQERTVAGLAAQMIRIGYHDEPSGREWIEQLVFIEGPDQQIYSVALKAQPGSIGRLEPAFEAIVRSWKLESSESVGSQPATSSPDKTAPTAAPH